MRTVTKHTQQAHTPQQAHGGTLTERWLTTMLHCYHDTGPVSRVQKYICPQTERPCLDSLHGEGIPEIPATAPPPAPHWQPLVSLVFSLLLGPQRLSGNFSLLSLMVTKEGSGSVPYPPLPRFL